MAEKTITLQWVGPTEEVHSAGPRPLEYHDRQDKVHFFDPEINEKGHVIYVVSEEFGRRLLGSQSDRFYLLSPDKVTVKFKTPGGMKTEFRQVHSIILTKKAPKAPMKIFHADPPAKGVPIVPIRTQASPPPPSVPIPPKADAPSVPIPPKADAPEAGAEGNGGTLGTAEASVQGTNDQSGFPAPGAKGKSNTKPTVTAE